MTCISTLDLGPRQLAKALDRCVGCEGPLSQKGDYAGSMWCPDCWAVSGANGGRLPDLLDGGRALPADV